VFCVLHCSTLKNSIFCGKQNLKLFTSVKKVKCMDQQNNKDNLAIWDYLIPGGLLFLSYWMLFFLPQQESWKFWIAFAVSVFLFCVGYFRLLETMPEATSKTGSAIRNAILMILGLGMFLFSLRYVYLDGASMKSLAAATLLLIESMVICGAVSSGDTQTSQLPRALFWVIIVGMAAAGLWFFVQEITGETQDSYGRVGVATLLWIAAGAWWYSMPVAVDSKNNSINKIRKKKNKK